MQPQEPRVPSVNIEAEIQSAYEGRSGREPILTNGQVVEARNINPQIELGKTGLKRWGGRIYQEFLPELRGARGMRVYDEMRKSDPVIGSIFSAIRASVRSVSWSSEAADESDPAKKWAVFLDQCMDDMVISWGELVSDALTMVPFGWSLFESVYKVRAGEGATQTSSFNDGLIGWDNIAFRTQESLYIWDIAANGRILGMVQMPPPSYEQIYLPIEKCVLFRTEHEANNPEGISLLRPCYRPWYYKKNLEEVEAIGIERDFTGVMVIQLPMNATEADHRTARQILETAKTDEMTGIKVQRGPNDNGRDDWEITLLQSPGTKSIDVNQAINRYASEIATAFLAQFLRLGQGSQSGGGSYALSRSHKDFFYLAVQALVDGIAETMNAWMVTPLMRLNNVPVELRPTISHGRIAPRELDSLVASIDLLARNGLLGPVDGRFINFLRGELDVPPTESDPQEWIAKRERMIDENQPQAPAGPSTGATVSR